jgi:excisionase family DNA binding protein
MMTVDGLGYPVHVTRVEHRDLLERIADATSKHSDSLRILTPAGQEIALPEPMAELLAEAAGFMLEDEGVVLLSSERDLSPQQASRLLNISRPYLVRLLDNGDIPFHRVGSHRRIRLEDLLAYRQQRDAARRDDLKKLSQFSRESGFPE